MLEEEVVQKYQVQGGNQIVYEDASMGLTPHLATRLGLSRTQLTLFLLLKSPVAPSFRPYLSRAHRAVLRPPM